MFILGSLESAYFLLIELFSLGVTAEALRANRNFAPTGAGWPKTSGRRGRRLPTILFLRKLG